MIKKSMILILASVILALIVALKIRPNATALSEYEFKLDKSQTYNNELTVRFLGNTNLLFSDGQHSILTDGFFTRPSTYQILFGKMHPNEKIIKECLSKSGIKKLDAVIPVHSHFDHAMDAPMVADLTGAQLIGSSSTINIGKGYGLNASAMMIPKLYEKIQIGKFSITFIPSKHWQYPSAKQRAQFLDQDIENPVVTPVKMSAYKEGISYTIIIEHDSTTIGIQGSAGFKPQSIKDQDVDVLFLAVAGLELMDDVYNNNYQEHLVDALQPETLVPIHYDDFTVPLSKGLKTSSLLFNTIFGTNVKRAFEIVRDNNKEINMYTLPLWEKIRLNSLID